MKTFFTADLHFNCPKLVKQTRPWISPEEHDQFVLWWINETVGLRDRLIIVGDFCKGKPHKYRQQIRCRDIWLVRGNHDQGPEAYESCFGKGRVRDIYDLKIDTGVVVNLKPLRQKVTCCHYPMSHWNCSHYGSFHCYGHTHAQKEDELDEAFPQRRSMDVGVDNQTHFFGVPKPFDDEFLFDYLGARTGHGIITAEDKWHDRDY